MTDSKPWEQVTDCAYFDRVLGIMRSFDSDARTNAAIVVRFGLGGRGVRPNYQVEAPGRVLAVSGNSHDADPNAPGGRYADQELSGERFNFQDVQALFRQCLDRSHGAV